jgi:hypothetical protein
MLSRSLLGKEQRGISGLVVEYVVAIDVTRVRFPADALFSCFADVRKLVTASYIFGLRIASPNIERPFSVTLCEWISFGSHLLKLERYRED